MFNPADEMQVIYRMYGPSPIPDERDHEVAKFVVALLQEGELAIDECTKTTSRIGRDVFRAFAERMASKAVRTREADLIEQAWVALVLGGLWDNDSEAQMVAAVVDDATKRLKLDLAGVVERVATQVGESRCKYLRSWLTRPKLTRSLRAMSYIATKDEDGFRYVYKT